MVSRDIAHSSIPRVGAPETAEPPGWTISNLAGPIAQAADRPPLVAVPRRRPEQSRRRRLMLLLDATSTDGTSATSGWTGLEAQPGAGGDHRRLAGVHGGDDLGVVDAL